MKSGTELEGDYTKVLAVFALKTSPYLASSHCKIAIKYCKSLGRRADVRTLKKFIQKLYYVHFYLEGDIIYNNNAQMLAVQQCEPIGTHFGGVPGLKASICFPFRKSIVSGEAPSLQNWRRNADAFLWVRLLTLPPISEF